MDSTASRADGTLVTSRVLPFSPQAVFAAMADPQRLARWWGPAGFHSTFEAFDFRPGGEWRFTMHGPDGTAYPNHNVFEGIEPGRRVVVRHPSPTHAFRLTIGLQPEGEGTRVVWHQAFDDPEECERMAPVCIPANEQNLDRLHAELASAT